MLGQVTPYRSKAAGLLTSATVFIYTAVVLFNALSSEPPGRCVLTAGNVSNGLQVRSAALFQSGNKYTLNSMLCGLIRAVLRTLARHCRLERL